MINTIQTVDMIVIGGGINGMAIAGQAACKGLKVVLIEQNDIASGTSSKSTQLIHGGLRYLQQYDFSLVRKALTERKILMQMAPHLIKPMEFIIPDYKQTTPRWLTRLGLFVYDHLSSHNPLPKAHRLDLSTAPYHSFLKKDIQQGLVYSDAITHDSRLVLEWALLAKQHQAMVLNYQSITALTEEDAGWQVRLADRTYQATMLVNATGPWVTRFHQQYFPSLEIPKMNLVKGSHLVVKKELPDNKSYLLECADGRIIFLTPYEPGYSLLGTTELEYEGSLEDIRVEETEIAYLLQSVNVYLQNPLQETDILARFAGVRPLVDDGLHSAHQLSRDYQLQLQQGAKGHLLLSVLGGKLTTHRRLAEEALILLQKNSASWSWHSDAFFLLPGGEPLDEAAFMQTYSFIPAMILARYLRSYGTLCLSWLKGKKTLDALGAYFGAGLYQAEVEYLLREEWVKTVEDLLWRRTRLGLSLDEIDVEKLKETIKQHVHPQ